MLVLETISPLAAAAEGFPRRGGQPYLPGANLRQAFLAAALAYAIQRDEAFAAEMRRLVEHGYKGSATGLAQAMEEALLLRQPELAGLDFPDIELEEVTTESVVLYDIDSNQATQSLELETFSGVARMVSGLPPELETWLGAATRGYNEALAEAESKALQVGLPDSEPFYQKLKSQVFRRDTWSLRVGYWTPDLQGGRFLALVRLNTVAASLRKRFDVAPLPRHVFFSPRAGAGLGWLVLRREN